MRQRRIVLAVGLMTIFLGASVGAMPLPERPALTAAPAYFGGVVTPPAIKKGDPSRLVTAEHRAALHIAYSRLEADRPSYERVQQEFGKAGD